MSFLFPTLLTIGLPLIAVPILIHLINLRRQQRIRWAAMQFLLESQRRNRRWILLKQLLLLATRMAVIAVLVLMLAHLVLRNEWLSLLGRGTTHHLVLLDDSYSMSDRWDETTALNEGKRAVQAIVDQAAQQSDTQLITLLRFSEAAQLSAGAQPKVFAEPINDTFRSKLESLLAGWERLANRRRPGRRAQSNSAAAAGRERPDAHRVPRERFSRPPIRQRHRDPQAARRPEGKREGRRKSTWSAACAKRGPTWRSRRSCPSPASGRPASKCG